MKILVISDENKILSKVPLHKSEFLVGRSPICDILIYRGDIKDVQFSICNRGITPEGAPSDEWVVFSQFGEESSYRGVVDLEPRELALNEQPQKFGNLYFSIVDDRRNESVGVEGNDRRSESRFGRERRQDASYEKGGLAKNLRGQTGDQTGPVGGQSKSAYPESIQDVLSSAKEYALEVIFINSVLNTVTNVSHLYGFDRKWRCFASAPQMFLTVNRHNQISLIGVTSDLRHRLQLRVMLSGYDITEALLARGQYTFNIKEQIHIFLGNIEYVLRMVPRQNYKLAQKNPFSDRLFLLSLGALVALLLFFGGLRFVDLPVKAIELKKTRIIKIESDPIPEPLEKEAFVVPPLPVPPSEDILKPPPPRERVSKPKPPSQRTSKVTESPLPPREVQSKVSSAAAVPQPPPSKASSVSSTKPRAEEKEKLRPETPELLNFLKKSSSLNKAPSLTQKALEKADNLDAQIELDGSIVDSAQLKIEPGLMDREAMNLESAKSNLSLSASKEVGLVKEESGRLASAEGLKGLGKAEVTSNKADVSGGLSRESVMQTLRAHSAAFAGCHNSALMRQPNAFGTMTFQWVISELGHVISLKKTQTDFSDSAFSSCIEDVLRGIKFEVSAQNQPTKVTNPFHFQAR